MPLEWLFGKKITPEQMMRQNQRALQKTIRELDREKSRLENEEKKVVADIKKMAQQGQMDAVKIMAKDLVRQRNYVKKFTLMRANIQAVSLKIQTLRSTNAMAQAMKGVTRTMQRMNKQMNLPQLQKIMMEFEKESATMEMKEEMMTDAIDDAMGEVDDEEEADKMVSQVLDELGIEMAGKLGEVNPDKTSVLPGAQANKTGPQAAAVGAGASETDDLESRLNNLKRT